MRRIAFLLLAAWITTLTASSVTYGWHARSYGYYPYNGSYGGYGIDSAYRPYYSGYAYGYQPNFVGYPLSPQHYYGSNGYGYQPYYAGFAFGHPTYAGTYWGTVLPPYYPSTTDGSTMYSASTAVRVSNETPASATLPSEPTVFPATTSARIPSDTAVPATNPRGLVPISYADFVGPTRRGMMITDVDVDSPAYRATLHAGDIIVAVGSVQTPTFRALQGALASAGGDAVNVRFIDGQTKWTEDVVVRPVNGTIGIGVVPAEVP